MIQQIPYRLIGYKAMGLDQASSSSFSHLVNIGATLMTRCQIRLFDFLDDGDSEAPVRRAPASRAAPGSESFDVTRVGTRQSVPSYLPPNPAAASKSGSADWHKLAMVAGVLLISAGLVLGGFEFLGNRSEQRTADINNATIPGPADAVPAGVALTAGSGIASTQNTDLRSRSEASIARLQQLLESGAAEQAQQLVSTWIRLSTAMVSLNSCSWKK